MGCVELATCIVALKLVEEMINSECGDVCQPNVICYAGIIDGLCKDGFVNKVRVLFLDMKGRGIYPDAFVYNSNSCLLCAVNWEDAKGLFIEMLD